MPSQPNFPILRVAEVQPRPFETRSAEFLKLSERWTYGLAHQQLSGFGEPGAVRLRVLDRRRKPVASRHTARLKRLSCSRARYRSDANGVGVDESEPFFLPPLGGEGRGGGIDEDSGRHVTSCPPP